MAADERLDHLSNQLSRQSLGPVNAVIGEVMTRLSAAVSALAANLRQAAFDQPLITLLLSCQLGYLAARVGRRHARR